MATPSKGSGSLEATGGHDDPAPKRIMPAALIRPHRRHLTKLIVRCGCAQNARLLRACRVRFWLAEQHWRSFWSLQPSSGPCRTIVRAGLYRKNSIVLITTMWPMAWPDFRATTRVFRAMCLALDRRCPAILVVLSLQLKLSLDRLRSMPSSSE